MESKSNSYLQVLPSPPHYQPHSFSVSIFSHLSGLLVKGGKIRLRGEKRSLLFRYEGIPQKPRKGWPADQGKGGDSDEPQERKQDHGIMAGLPTSAVCSSAIFFLSLSSTCHLYLNCRHDLCSYGRKTQPLSGLSCTRHSFCYLDKQRHLSQNKFLNAGSYFYESM